MTGKNQCTFHQTGKERITKEVASIAPNISGEYLVIELEDQDCIEVGLGVVYGLVQTLPLLGAQGERLRVAREK